MILSYFFKKYKIELLFFAVAFLLRILLLWIMVFKNGGNFLDFSLGGDAYSYYNLAFNLKYFLSLKILEAPDFSDAFLRTPGYPIFLAFILLLFNKSVMALMVTQAAISGLTTILIYKIAANFGFKKFVSWGAAGIFALDPTIAMFSNMVLAESLFLFLFLISIYFVSLIFKYKPSNQKLFLAGIFWGMAILVRPVLYPLFIPMAVFLWLYFFKKKLVFQSFKLTVLFVVGVLIFVFPWVLRNKIVFNSWSVSSIGSAHFYGSYAVPFYAYKQGITNKKEAYKKLWPQISPLLRGDQFDIRNNSVYQKFAWQIIRQDIPGYVFFHVSNGISFFLSNGYRNLPRDLGFKTANPELNYSFMRLLINGKIMMLFNFLVKHPVDFIIFAVGAGVWTLINIFMIAGLIIRFLKKERNFIFPLLLVGLLIFYFAAVSGPEAYYKMRFPANPFMFIAAFYGLSEFLNFKLKVFKVKT